MPTITQNLEAVRALLEGLGCFTNVIVGIESDAATTDYSLPSCIITLDGVTWDGENPTLGLATFSINIIAASFDTPDGQSQITQDLGVIDLAQRVVDAAYALSGGEWGARTTVTARGMPMQASDRSGSARWIQTLSGTCLLG